MPWNAITVIIAKGETEMGYGQLRFHIFEPCKNRVPEKFKEYPIIYDSNQKLLLPG
jgi:hypothetical protein